MMLGFPLHPVLHSGNLLFVLCLWGEGATVLYKIVLNEVFLFVSRADRHTAERLFKPCISCVICNDDDKILWLLYLAVFLAMDRVLNYPYHFSEHVHRVVTYFRYFDNWHVNGDVCSVFVCIQCDWWQCGAGWKRTVSHTSVVSRTCAVPSLSHMNTMRQIQQMMSALPLASARLSKLWILCLNIL